ncbi:hypothetical protein ACFQ1E_00425 [Sphingomonas canadensis]|uniref:Lipoprotein n=1 Tax=Sphingomonas canadensis TaxID=1219257 RepID=A0ABW3H056_9SPHN|nr:hypothetical protein [Sphingomonas canadensis]MCW3835296.1 hypothetical protein [Sphingomonas canadensis]
MRVSVALPALAGVSLLLSGCGAPSVLGVATMPFKAGAQAADWATTSQDESDRNYGRKMRKQEARDAKARKEREAACRKKPRNCGGDGYETSFDH